MPTATRQKPLTATQRASAALTQSGEALGLDDQKLLSAALLEAAAEGVRRNTLFAAHVRRVYEELQAQAKPKPKPRPTRPAFDVELKPIRQIEGREANPAAPPDPYFLNDLYGPEQLRLALGRYTVAKLKPAAEEVRNRNPGTGPTNKGQKQPLIDYIVEHVAGPGY